MINKKIKEITDRIIERSKTERDSYLESVAFNFNNSGGRSQLSCGNLAHAFAGCGTSDKKIISEGI